MTIQEFITKAIEGGWNPWRTIVMPQPAFVERVDFDTWSVCDNPNFELSAPRGRISQSRMFLDPEAWRAVYKDGFWREAKVFINLWTKGNPRTMPTWQYKMHRMIDALAEGKSVEEYLASL